jgi:hypothetical protein
MDWSTSYWGYLIPISLMLGLLLFPVLKILSKNKEK